VLEIIVETLQDALAAQAGGASQVDFKSAFPIDGLTPSAGMMKRVLPALDIDVLLLIRPHARSFVYTRDDIDAMCANIRLGKKLGAGAFLLGALTHDGRVDIEAMRAFQEAADGLPLHFNLAWELSADSAQALETAIELGVKSARIAGGAKSAIDGVDQIRRLASLAAGRIDLFLARGVNEHTVGQLVAATGVTHAHAGRGVRSPQTPYGAVDEDRVRRLAAALDASVASLSDAH
jgi:copper homeostasis protein